MISAGVFLLGFQAPFRLLPRHRAAVLQARLRKAEGVHLGNLDLGFRQNPPLEIRLVSATFRFQWPGASRGTYPQPLGWYWWLNVYYQILKVTSRQKGADVPREIP